MSILPFPVPKPAVEPCRLCAEQGRTFDETGLPIFKRALPGGLQDCLLCDGSGWPHYQLIENLSPSW